ncbi:MAG TPA: branched-chain amino acid ABC transporter permease [Yinghuangia sp.]|nr:branched-chain amino acid ABC transporter permease [Yinghuangia sp.]
MKRESVISGTTAERPADRTGRTLRIGAAVVVAVLLCAVPSQTDVYTTFLATQALVFGLLAVGVGVLTGHAGLATMGQVAPYAVGAYTTAWLTRQDITNGLVHLAVAALAAALFSAITGPVVIRARGVVVIMLTLAVGELTATAANQWKSFTGGTDGLAGIPATRVLPGTPELLNEDQVYVYVLVVTAVVAGVTALVLRSPAGLLLAGCRENEARMRAAGHPVDRYLLIAYIGAGAIGGIGGALLITYQRYVSPEDVGFDVSALALLAVVIGGVRSITGALAGAALIVFTRDWLGGWWPGHAPLFLGLLFLVAVYVLPDGAAGFAGRARAFGRGIRSRNPDAAKSEAA